MSKNFIGRRVKAYRESRGQSQTELANVLGISDRQSIGQIEAGDRRLRAEELIRLMEHFGVPLADFTNPYLMVGEQRFSWRQTDVRTDDLRAFERMAGQWVEAYRELGRLAGLPTSRLLHSLDLTTRNSYEDAREAAEALADDLGLGDCPSEQLGEVIQDRLGILVLMVDTLPGVSGAACLLDDLSAILINRNEPESRRNFDLAHELFHLLTWRKMPPCWIDGNSHAATPQQRNQVDRIERLADNFAGGLLMPRRALDALDHPGHDVAHWIVESARRLGVSGQALRIQLMNTGRATQEIIELSDDALRPVARRGRQTVLPPFNRRFADRLATAIERGDISAARAEELVGLDSDKLGAMLDEHAVERPSTLRDEVELLEA